MPTKATTIKLYAAFWLAAAAFTGVWLVMQRIQFTQCCSGESDMGIAITEFLFGWAAVIVGFNALLLLIFKNNVVRMLSIIFIGGTTTLFFLSSISFLSLVCLAAAIYVMVCASQVGKQPKT